MSQRIGADFLEASRARRAARACAASGRSGGASPRCSRSRISAARQPCGARAFALDDPRLPIARRAARRRRTGCRSAARHGISAPSARTASAPRRRAAGPLFVSSVGEARSSATSSRWSSSAVRASGSGRQADRDRRFLDRLADCGDRRGVDRRARSPSVAVGLVDPAAGEDQRAGGEGHALGALDHQQLGRMAAARVSRTTIRVAAGMASSLATGRRGSHAADVLLLASLGLTALSVAAFACRAAAAASERLGLGVAASLAASLASSLSSSRAGLVQLGIVDLILIVCCCTPQAPSAPFRPRQKPVFSCVSVPRMKPLVPPYQHCADSSAIA